MYIKEFDAWNKKKKKVNIKNVTKQFFYYEREVWWASVGVNIGNEIDGKNKNFERPILVLKIFNRKQFWGVPLTSKKRKHPLYILVKHDKGISYANLSQLRVFGSERFLRKIGMIQREDFYMVKKALKKLLV